VQLGRDVDIHKLLFQTVTDENVFGVFPRIFGELTVTGIITDFSQFESDLPALVALQRLFQPK